MIKIVMGDLLEAKEKIIGHQVNCQGKMNSGVAKSIRERFPEAYADYMRKSSSYERAGMKRDLLGQCQIVQTDDGSVIANLFGQFNYGYDGQKYTNEAELYNAFKELRIFAEKHKISVALPYMIGCYRGGGDWKVVENYLLKAFDGYEVTLYKHHEG